jgi:hypothetical protein
VDVIVTIYPFVVVTMDGFILSVDMCMRMDMFMFVGMRQISVSVFVVMDMGMLMGVLQGDGVFDH